MMLEVCPCNLPYAHDEHVYEWVKTGDFILCPGRGELSDLEVFMQAQPKYRRSIYLHLGAMFVLTCIMVAAILSTDEAYTFGWWIVLGCVIVNLLLGTRAKRMIEERREELSRLMVERPRHGDHDD